MGIIPIFLIPLFNGALPIQGHSKSRGAYPSGGIGLVLLSIIVPLLLGRIGGGVAPHDIVLVTNDLPHFWMVTLIQKYQMQKAEEIKNCY